MVNLTYGVIDGSTGTINSGGTDLIATAEDGTVASYDPGDLCWVMMCSALVWLMIPGLGFLYSGLVRRKNALSSLFITIAALAVVSFQWFFWGYSLTFSKTGGSFWGNLRNFGFMGVLELPIPEANNKIPELVFAIYQSMFASLVPAIILGAAAERSRFLPAMVFTFCWTTLVYDPLAHWIWSANGWAFKWGVLDYAGGVPIEIASGTAGLAYSYYIGHRRGYLQNETLFKPHNISHVVLGTVFLWVGWLGFNGGSTFAANLRAAMAIFTTNLAGASGGITWMLLDFRLEKKWSPIGFCTGAICGLVAITPAAGFVGGPAALLIGVASSAASNSATRLKNVMRVDDPLDIFACHALSGVIGTLLTGIFAQASVANNDAYAVIPGGWLDGNFRQLGLQVAWVMVGLVWTFTVTLAIMFVIDHIPGLHFRSTDEAEIVGMDEVEHGEYIQDYVSLRRDLESTFSPLDAHTHTQNNTLARPASLRSRTHDLDEEEKGRGRERYWSKERTIIEVGSGSDEEGKGHGRFNGLGNGNGNGNGLGVNVEGNGAAGAGKEETLRLRSRSRGRGVGGVSSEEIEMQPSSNLNGGTARAHPRHSPSPNRHASPRARRLSELIPGAPNEPTTKED